VIDLHLHTTASDGRSEPVALVQEAWAKGIRAMSVTDHDTTGGLAAAAAECQRIGMEFVTGIEVTAVHRGRDVHVLGYGIRAESACLQAAVAGQREKRAARAREIADRLAKLGVPIDIERLFDAGSDRSGKSLARPQIAAALIAAGHVESVAEAFQRFLGEHGPAYVPHQGAGPVDVIRTIAAAGGIASLAHPGYSRVDELIPTLADEGLACLEAFHCSHDEASCLRYLRTAEHFRLGVTGGSDYHGIGTRRAEFFGVTVLPRDFFERFKRQVNAAVGGLQLSAGS
jgi:predicted metal-dependent phosphoesterase TrpH